MKYQKKVSQGDLSQRANIQRKDEIGRLADSFNGMVNNLELSQNELTAYQVELESRVEQRTKELKELTETLEHRVRSEIKKTTRTRTNINPTIKISCNG